MSKIQDIEKIINNFRSQCATEGMTDIELPDTIKGPFKDFEVYVLDPLLGSWANKIIQLPFEGY